VGTVGSPRRATHVGPVGSAAGGIEAVLRTYSTADWPHFDVSVIGSWSSSSRLFGLGPFLAALWHLLTRRRADLGVVHVHLSQEGAFLREGTLLRVAAMRRLAVCCTIHGSRFERFADSHPRLVRSVLKRARVVLVLSPAIRDRLARELRTSRVILLPNAVRIPAQPKLSAGECPPLAVFAGAVSKRKGVDVLVAAWSQVMRKLPDACLLVLGPSTDYVVDAALPGADVRGAVSQADVLAELARCRIAVLPSRAEGMSIFLLEAMSRGRPVVSTPVGGIPELVVDGTGVLVEPGDAAGLAAALVEYLSQPDRADADGAAAREHVVAHHSFEQLQQRLEAAWTMTCEAA
jgi:glycosyltransferase involved in cell wall biosynthesis